MAWEPLASVAPVDTAVLSATAQGGGVRLTVEVEENPLPAGATRWITTTLENVGPDPIQWWTDGCEIDVGVRAESAFHWAWGDAQPSVGFRPADFAAFTFKDWTLRTASGGGDGPIALDITPESLIALGDVGCADVGIAHHLAAGGRIVERSRWEGLAAFDFGPPPGGPATMTAIFRNWWKDGEEEMSREDVVVELGVQIVDGRPPDFISPGQAIDVALRAPALQRLLERYPTVREWIGSTVVKVEDGRWTVGLAGGDGHSVRVIVDPMEATILDVIESP